MNFIDNLIQHWNAFDWRLALIVFLAYLAVDALYAQYTLNVVKFKSRSAATLGSLIYIIIAFGVLNYINNYLYIIPLAFGSWIGTFIVVEQARRKNIASTSIKI